MSPFWRLMACVKPHWRSLLVALACMVMFAIFSGFSIGMVSPFIQVLFRDPVALQQAQTLEEPSLDISSPDDLGKMKDYVKLKAQKYLLSSRPLVSLERICFVILIVMLIKTLFNYGQTYLIASVEQKVIKDLRDRLYSHLHALPLSFFHSQRTGRLISRITNDVSMIRGTITAVFSNVVRDTLLLFVCLFLVFWASWHLALVSLAVLPPSMFLIVTISKKLRRDSTLIQERMGDITAVLQETISGIRVVKSFGMESFEQNKFFRFTKAYLSSFLRLRRIGAMAAPLSEYVGVVVGTVVLWFGGRQILQEQTLQPDRFFVFMLAMFSMMTPIKSLSQVNTKIQEGLAAAKRVFKLLDTEPQMFDSPRATGLTSLRNSIEFRNVCFSYDGAADVLKDVSFTVEVGQVLAIVGPSGAGKSTLVDLLPKFYAPTSGSILFDGVDVLDIKTDSLRALMGIVTQETILFNDTVWNNIAYGCEDIPEEEVVRAARAANAHQFIAMMPSDYQTVMGERGVRLSGGQRQRIAIARAVLKNPPILILDEATSALDTESELLVQQAIERLMRNRTTFVIAHRLSTVQRADQIIVLDRGRIVQRGTHESLLSEEGMYRRLYELQFTAPESARTSEAVQ
ncbi:MAG: ATP-binding cassette domain-containing protein [Candidatus Eiseniibacteriota bacterium]|nr:MAG: ATP-binding cassette domain-containing protein [Candidatus Eisenbacteria bacterium]